MSNNYRIIHATNLSQLEREVNKLIEIGFEPIGGFIYNSKSNPSFPYHQTMYKTSS